MSIQLHSPNSQIHTLTLIQRGSERAERMKESNKTTINIKGSHTCGENNYLCLIRIP